MRIYIDTNVYLDFFLERGNANHAYKIFKKTLLCHHQIILSNHLIIELSKNMDYSKAKFLFETLKHKLILVHLEDADKEEAKKITTHYADALHIVLAKKSGADCIITNNTKDFSSIFKTHSPESFRQL